MTIIIDNCEECGEPIIRSGNTLYCPNGCYEDDVRNFSLGDGPHEDVVFPKDDIDEDEMRDIRQRHDACAGCHGEDCVCCDVARGY